MTFLVALLGYEKELLTTFSRLCGSMNWKIGDLEIGLWIVLADGITQPADDDLLPQRTVGRLSEYAVDLVVLQQRVDLAYVLRKVDVLGSVLQDGV